MGQKDTEDHRPPDLRELAPLDEVDRVYTVSNTREAWLLHGTEVLRADFRRLAVPLPAVVRVSVSFPLGGRRVIGQCWATSAIDGDHFNIFITPTVDDGIEALTILAHELCHIAVGCEWGHGPVFGHLARRIGLDGPLTATVAGPRLAAELTSLAALLGPYPHRKVGRPQAVKTQSTRMVKVMCPTCGYLVRTTRRWLDLKGPPICPDGSRMITA